MVNINDLKKDDEIKSIVRFFANKFGQDKFKIKDYWDGDLCAIGLADNEEKYLLYISIHGSNNFYVSLENLVVSNGLPYEPVGDYDNVDLRELDRIFVKHLRIERFEP